MRIGVFGGAFNPPHVGHLVCAQEAHAQLGLRVVVWVPIGTPPHRSLDGDPGREARYTMCDHATAGDERFGLSRIEVDRDGPSYMADTLAAMREQEPGADLVLILGADQAAALSTWHRPGDVLRLATVAVAAREGADAVDPGFERFEMPRIDVSSTMVRERAAAGQPIRYLVPDGVASFIGAQGLYGASVAS